ncbi:helix-turn-helix transcriptional regulator [Nocardioides terrisoli]|uniref:helix-turn-helix transcriptional regulator n=1 Tax=Nocardioides terrisoli TaxID=3388267 RepID=UPI00287BB730|nr:helix-turn-helix transcriptional regulator [Nocardioides marmorisolisilvae]
MSSAFAEEAIRIHRTAALSDSLIAEAVGAKPSTVRDWFNGRSSPTGPRARRLAELVEITDRLARVMQARYIPLWLVKPVEALDDYAPVELIARGQAREVARLISALESPGAA